MRGHDESNSAPDRFQSAALTGYHAFLSAGAAMRRDMTGWRTVSLHLAMLAMMAAAALALPPTPAAAVDRAIVLEIEGAIGPPLADYIARELTAARTDDARLIVLRMNTPGGLDTSMRKIISAILASPVPVATYVAPNGARAASAGTYIAYASAIAAMAPGTNIGAATPIQLGGNPLFPSDQKSQKDQKDAKPGEPADTETRKIINDAVAYIRSLAALNGRNADWATDAVRSAASLPASEALALHVIDVIADDVPDLLRKIDGREVTIMGKPQQLATAGLDIVVRPPDWQTELLMLVTNPNVAFILMLIGVYGLILEFFNPGAVAPGLIGAISLLVALYALAFMPINYAGAALVLLGVALMIAEVHIGAFGALGVGGIAAFVIGALMMFPAHAPGFTLSGGVIAGTALGTAALFLLALAALLRRKRPVVTGDVALIGAEGETVAWQNGEGRVRVKGEIWLARAAAPLAAGSRVKIIGRDGLVLRVEGVGSA
jgi:membrane-bound serine protease (ClpP class)